MITAGFQGLCSKIELLDHEKYHIVKSSVDATLSMSMGGKKVEDAILDAVVNAALGTVTASLVAKTDVAEINNVKNSIVHTILGGIKGTLIGENGFLMGALDGLISAVVPNDLFVSGEETKEETINMSKKQEPDEYNLTLT
jgi:predicted RNA-binding protein Jag